MIAMAAAACAAPGGGLPYQMSGGEIRQPLAASAPDAERGRKVLVSREANCILCHAVPESGEKGRIRLESFADHYSQARQFYLRLLHYFQTTNYFYKSWFNFRL